MDTEMINTWAVKIAEAAVPDEVDLAPIVMQAFLQKGRERQELFRQAQGDVVGGFGAGELQAIFPWILQGIAAAAPILYTAITSGAVEKFLSAIKDLLMIGNEIRDFKKRAETLPDDPYILLKKMITTLLEALAEAKISQEQRDLVVGHVIQEVLRDKTSVKVLPLLHE
jgi:hypothetical protein